MRVTLNVFLSSILLSYFVTMKKFLPEREKRRMLYLTSVVHREAVKLYIENIKYTKYTKL